VVVGTQAIGRVELFLGGTIRTFTIQFQPAGFHELLRIPMVELAGKGLDASGVLGPRIDWLNNQLCNSPNFETMAHVADEFLLYFLKTSGRMTDPFFANLSSNLNRVLGGVSRVELDTLVNDSGVGQRQFERRFKTAIGVSPKRYLRVARLHRALRLRERRPEWAWGRIASECGFHDQMHLIHDFRELGGEAPNALFREMTDLREQMSEIYYP
jgi:AraC-like DNA-binding protein